MSEEVEVCLWKWDIRVKFENIDMRTKRIRVYIHLLSVGRQWHRSKVINVKTEKR